MVVMVHGVAAGKGEWAPFAQKLQGLGLGTLALDLRGHGESLRGPAGSRDFSDFDATGEWPRTSLDLEAAIAYLRKKGLPLSRVALAGASIGANLAARAASERRFAWVVLLSPGADYRGVELAREFGGNKAVLAASPADAYAYSAAAAYAGRYPLLAATHGHGVQMFEDPAFLKALLEWIEAQKSSDRK